MEQAVFIALVALGSSVLSTAATIYWAPALQARREARQTLDSFREPLAAAAYELQARLKTILKHQFVENWVLNDGAAKQQAAVDTTLYVFAQYFAWREIIRTEIQYLRFARTEQTRAVGRLLSEIGETFLTDQLAPQFMIWRVEQRGLGERMIVSSNGKPSCMGYATFIDERQSMNQWLEPLEGDLASIDEKGRERLTKLQHLLLELVDKLDEKTTLYPHLDKA